MVGTRTRASSINSLNSQRSNASSRARRAEARNKTAKVAETKSISSNEEPHSSALKKPSSKASASAKDVSFSKVEKEEFTPSDFTINERVLVKCEKENKFVPGKVSIIRVRKIKVQVDGRPKAQAIWVSGHDSIRRPSELPTITEESAEKKETGGQKELNSKPKRTSTISKVKKVPSTKTDANGGTKEVKNRNHELNATIQKNLNEAKVKVKRNEKKTPDAEPKTNISKSNHDDRNDSKRTDVKIDEEQQRKLTDAELLLQQISSELNVPPDNGIENDSDSDSDSDSCSDDEKKKKRIVKPKPTFKLTEILKPKSEGNEKVDERATMWSSAGSKQQSGKRERSKLAMVNTKLNLDTAMEKGKNKDADHRDRKRIQEKKIKRQIQRDWFDMKTPQLTQELKEDLRALQLRHYMDPKRFYKANDSKTIPKTFQVGTVIAGAADDRFSRLTRKERKPRFVDEILADKKITNYAKRVFKDIAKINEAGGRGDYRKRQKRRTSKNKKKR